MKPRRHLRRSRCAPQSAIESLETRTLLTGNVTASIIHGTDLLIQGDGQANQVALQSTNTGALQVSSLDGTTKINGGAGPFTTGGAFSGNVFVFLGAGNDVLKLGVSGGSSTSLPKDLFVSVGAGTDNVQVQNTSIAGNASILGGRGTDTFAVGSGGTDTDVSIGGNLFMVGGNGPDTLAVFNANITGDLVLCGGGGADHIQVGFDSGLGIIGVDETSTGHVNVGGNVKIDAANCDCDMPTLWRDFSSCDVETSVWSFIQRELKNVNCNSGINDVNSLFNDWRGCFLGGIFGAFGCSFGAGCAGGDDHVALADVNITGNLCIKTGGGADEVLVGAAHTPAADITPLSNLVFGHVAVGGNMTTNTGSGDDTLVLVDVSVDGNTSMYTGRGNDHVAVLESTSFTGSFSLDTGSGADSAVLASNAFLGSVNVKLGKGSDVIWLAQNFFDEAPTINGGKGSDTFFQSQSLFPNIYNGGVPVEISIESDQPNVSPTDPAVVAAFSWLQDLLGSI